MATVGSYKPRHAVRDQHPAASETGRARVKLLGRSLEKLTVLRAGLVLVGAGIVVGSLFLPSTNKRAPALAPGRTSPVPGQARTPTRPVPRLAESATAAGAPTTSRSSSSGHRASSARRKATPVAPQPASASTPRSVLASVPEATTVTTSFLAISSPARNLPTPPGLGPLLRQAWVAADPGRTGMAAADVRATVAGSVYYALQPAIATRWAIARFVPAPVATGAVLAQFNGVAAFEQPPGGPWSYLGESSGPCGADVPMPVLKAWGLCSSPGS
ncbi:MAG: hypothetical protein ACP5VR_05680 [Acidimicrobiales bacterium]